MHRAVRNFLLTLVISIQKKVVVNPMLAMPKEKASYTVGHWPYFTPLEGDAMSRGTCGLTSWHRVRHLVAGAAGGLTSITVGLALTPARFVITGAATRSRLSTGAATHA